MDFLWDDDSSVVQQQKKGLMVEKECVFKPIFLDEFCENVNSMLMTTQGYSDEQSRAFLKYFSQYHNIKIQALTDMGQEGASIIAHAIINMSQGPLLHTSHTISILVGLV